MLRLATILFLLFLVFPGCGQESPLQPSDPADGTTGELVTGTGTILYASIEGGCWILSKDGGPDYQPLGLSDSYLVDQMRVNFMGTVRTDIAGFCPGIFLDIQSISPL